ncbi:MAG: PEP-CTERM sorting domain-containing protein [Sedimentisphaerales bacterium]|nr:PEP-CTERM sorting domain-containing protein [Sedimentisphaerales bacterium]
MNRNELASGRILAIALTVILGAAVCASAAIFLPPSWRGEEGTTFQQWSFSEQNYAWVNPDADPPWDNDFGTPQLFVDRNSLWNATVGEHTGVWTFEGLMGGVGIDIPNNPVSSPEKEMWVELTWKEADLMDFIPNVPSINVVADLDSKLVERIQEISIGDGWKSTLFKITLQPNPPREWVTITGDILLDQVIIDTYCIPEPATLGLLSAGALLAFRRRRNVSKV